MKKIIFFNTSISTSNIGDKIIMESCYKILKTMFKDSFFIDLPTHIILNRRDFWIMKNNNYMFVCGTNLLRGMKLFSFKNQWKIGFLFLYYILSKKINNIILVGVGWTSYKYSKISFLEKIFLRKLLINGHIHSVRDEYTKLKLNEIGINNVINTGCLTTWNLTKEHCKNIPTQKSEKVVVTLTDYDKDYKEDKLLFDIIAKNYKNIYFWPQGSGDLEYINDLLKNTNIDYEIISPNYESYYKFLEENECDFIGTRLHGGIKALQMSKRTIIIGIDNRALEMKKNNLPVIARNEIKSKLELKIKSNFSIDINLLDKEIENWKKQFYKI